MNLEEKEILRREKQYDSEVKKKADADRYAIEQNAEAEKSKQMAEADAEKYRIEARATADAEKVRLDGLAKADSQRAQGESEADIIRLKGLAEAEAKRKIAEAFEQYGQAAVLDMIVKMIQFLMISEPASRPSTIYAASRSTRSRLTAVLSMTFLVSMTTWQSPGRSPIWHLNSTLDIRLPRACETPADLAAVRSAGYDEAQGFYFSLPVPARAVRRTIGQCTAKFGAKSVA